MRTKFLKCLVVIVTIIFCMGLMEISLRIIGKKPTNVTEGIFVQHGNSYRLAKNIEKEIKWPSYSYTVFTNSFGFRDSTRGERVINGKQYFVVLGNSAVFGNGVNYEDTFIGILHDHAINYDIDILNLAVGGHHFEDQKELLFDFINSTDRKPAKILICVDPFLINTFNKGSNLVIVKSGYLFGASNWFLPYIKVVFSNLSSAYGFFRDTIRNIQTKYFKSPASHLNLYMSVYSKKNLFSNKNTLMEFYNYLDSINEICNEINALPIYIYLPPVYSFYLYEELLKVSENPNDYDTSFYVDMMRDYCETRYIEFINLRPVLEEYPEKGTQLSFKTDAHYNVFTNRIVGEYLARTILGINKDENDCQLEK